MDGIIEITVLIGLGVFGLLTVAGFAIGCLMVAEMVKGK